MGYESETDTFFYLSGIEGEDLSFMSFSYYPQDTQKDCNYLGKVRINLLPLPDSDFTLILPSCKVIICLHKLSPIPEPDVLVVKKGTNILSRTSGKIPSQAKLLLLPEYPYQIAYHRLHGHFSIN